MTFKYLRTGVLAVCFAAIPALGVAYDIDDNYVGADDNGYGDVIGSTSDFQISGVNVSLSGSSLTVDVHTNFAGKSGTLFTGSITGGTGIGYGDLFLAGMWDPYGSATYSSDNNTNGTLWEYGFSLDGRFTNPGEGSPGTGTLYRLNGADNDANALLSEDFLSGGTFRNGQEVAVDTSDAGENGTVTAIGNGSWFVTSDMLRMTFDIGGTELMSASELAMHWALTCANDVIEGSYDVPEPGSLSLMLLSLAGFGLIHRRRAS